MVREGAFAGGVNRVLPTLTYPSHTTLITSVSPGRRGIVNNLTFDPEAINQTGWYWYAEDLRAPTLCDVAHAAGLVTVNVHWPVSVAARIDYNLPQIWRAGQVTIASSCGRSPRPTSSGFSHPGEEPCRLSDRGMQLYRHAVFPDRPSDADADRDARARCLFDYAHGARLYAEQPCLSACDRQRPGQVQVAMAAGLSWVGSVFVGTLEGCARILAHGIEAGGDLDAYCQQAVGEHRSAKRSLPGFAIPAPAPSRN